MGTQDSRFAQDVDVLCPAARESIDGRLDCCNLDASLSDAVNMQELAEVSNVDINMLSTCDHDCICGR